MEQISGRDIAGLLQIEYDNDIMERNINIHKMSLFNEFSYNYYANDNPYVGNYIDQLAKKESELQDQLDDQCLKFVKESQLLTKTIITFENRKSLLRASMTNQIKKELEEEVQQLEKENRELQLILEELD